MHTILKRLREPSTWAGLSGLLLLLGMNVDQAQALGTAAAGLAGAVAVFLPDQKAG